MFATFYEGQEVLTRRGKTGTVVRTLEGGKVLVRFGGSEFEMRETQLVGKRGYEKAAARSTRVPGQNLR